MIKIVENIYYDYSTWNHTGRIVIDGDNFKCESNSLDDKDCCELLNFFSEYISDVNAIKYFENGIQYLDKEKLFNSIFDEIKDEPWFKEKILRNEFNKLVEEK